MVDRINRACKFFPCHKHMEDCTFCFCPFYPCLDARLGRFVYSQSSAKKVWSCQDCNWIHRKKVVDEIFGLIRQKRHLIDDGYLLRKPRHQRDKAEKTGVIILAHGSRLKQANGMIKNIVEMVKRRLSIKEIMQAYLQFSQPTLAEAVADLTGAGCERIIVIPFFLFEGNHVRRDIPKALEKEKAKFPNIDFTYAKNLGQDERLSEILMDRIKEELSI